MHRRLKSASFVAISTMLTFDELDLTIRSRSHCMHYDGVTVPMPAVHDPETRHQAHESAPETCRLAADVARRTTAGPERLFSPRPNEGGHVSAALFHGSGL